MQMVNGDNLMAHENYLQWLVRNTATGWWHDSADPDEVRQSIFSGASGVTTNPILTAATLEATPDKWRAMLDRMPKTAAPGERAEYLLRNVAVHAAAVFEPVYDKTKGKAGYVCAQVHPSLAGSREIMAEQARRFCRWAPNISVKLPATSAGLDVLEDCVAEGICVTATVSFTVSQVLAVAQRHRLGAERARLAGKKPGVCFPVIMIGRIDDYLREVADDNQVEVQESDIRQAGLAIVKRAYQLCREHNYNVTLIVAALRGAYHMAELVGGELVVSIHPKIQEMLLAPAMPRVLNKISEPVPDAVIRRLGAMPEFKKAYEPDGLSPEEFVAYGATQRTLSQFVASGLVRLEGYKA